MFGKVKAIIKDVCMKFYDKTKPLYIGIDASGVRLGAALLQKRSNTRCHRDGVPDNSMLRSTAFSSKASLGQERDTATLKEKQWGYYTALNNSIIIAL